MTVKKLARIVFILMGVLSFYALFGPWWFLVVITGSLFIAMWLFIFGEF